MKYETFCVVEALYMTGDGPCGSVVHTALLHTDHYSHTHLLVFILGRVLLLSHSSTPHAA